MSVTQDLTDLLNDTKAEEDLVFIGLKNQPILLPSTRGGRTAKRNIHFIRELSLKPNIWIGELHRGDEWIKIYKRWVKISSGMLNILANYLFSVVKLRYIL